VLAVEKLIGPGPREMLLLSGERLFVYIRKKWPMGLMGITGQSAGGAIRRQGI
jgi:hypothetical protein